MERLTERPMPRKGCLATLALLLTLTVAAPLLRAQQVAPDWCRALPRQQYSTLDRVPVRQDWFQVYKVAPGVFAIYEPHQWEETIGYLILGKKKALLFDTGMGIGDLKALTAELTPLPVIVLNSHTHVDHVGNNWQFDTVYGMDTAFTRNNALGSKAAAQEEILPKHLCGPLPEGFDKAAYATRPWKITKFLHDGDVIDLGDRRLKIIATPGHTPDSICLLDPVNGLLFTGDTYYDAPIYVSNDAEDLAAYAASAHRIAALAPQLKMLLCAHNVPVASPSVLPRLAEAADQVRNHKAAETKNADGSVSCKANGIEFLLFPPSVGT